MRKIELHQQQLRIMIVALEIAMEYTTSKRLNHQFKSLYNQIVRQHLKNRRIIKKE